MAVLPQLSAKHQVLLAAVADPRVDAARGGPRRRRRGLRRRRGRTVPQRPAGDRVAAAAQRRRRGRRPARGTGARAGRPLPGDEGHRPALARWAPRRARRRRRRSRPPAPPCGRSGIRKPGKRFRLPHRCRCGRTSAAATASPAPRSARPPAARRPARPRPRPPPGPARRAPARAAGCPATTTDQPSRIPTAPARNTAVSSISPCGVSSPRKMSPLPASNISPAITPRLAAFWKST